MSVSLGSVFTASSSSSSLLSCPFSWSSVSFFKLFLFCSVVQSEHERPTSTPVDQVPFGSAAEATAPPPHLLLMDQMTNYLSISLVSTF